MSVIVARPRLSGAVGISLGIHALFFVALVIMHPWRTLAPPIPIELLAPPPPVTMPPEGAPPPSPEAAPAPSATPSAGPTASPLPKPRPPRPPRPKTALPASPLPPPPPVSDVRNYAPDGVRLALMFRNDKLRTSVHRANVEQLLSALPDHATLLGGTDLSLFDDFDALVIATPNPHDVRATFLAALSPPERAVQGKLEHRKLADWDPRVFRFPQPGLGVLVGPEQLARLEDPQTPLAKQLEHLRDFITPAEGPALVVTVADLRALIRFGADLPTPDAVSLAMTADPSPLVRVTAQMLTLEDAIALEAAWPAIKARYRARVALLGIGGALDDLKPIRKDKTFELIGKIDEIYMRLALGWAGVQLRAQREAGAQ